MDIVSAQDGVALYRMIVGGLLAGAAVSVAFGPELLRRLGRLRDPHRESAVVPAVESAQAPRSSRAS